MTDKLRAAAEMALEALAKEADLYESEDGPPDSVENAMNALRQALAEPDTGIDRGAWADVPDATKWVDELRGDEEPPTDSQIIAGAIFDFAGFLTTRDKVIKVGASANAAPVVDLVKEWADMRELSLDDAAVLWWKDVLEEPPNSTTDVVESKPVAWGMQNSYGQITDVITPKEHDRIEGAYTIPLYTAPPKPDLLNQTCCECGRSGGYALYCVDCWNKASKWQGLTDEELLEGATYEFDRGVRWAEAKLKAKNT